MNSPDPEVDAYLDRARAWQDETRKLRAVLLDCGLDEGLKWGKPCYSFGGGNVAIVQGFKEHCSLMFFKGALLDDTHGILVRPGENSQAAMRVQFTSPRQVDGLEPAVRDYIGQAIEVEKAGLKVDFKARRDLEMPEELRVRLAEDPDLAAAFDSLTPGRRRAYVLHFSSAKRAGTRRARIERAVASILAGKGPNDR